MTNSQKKYKEYKRRPRASSTRRIIRICNLTTIRVWSYLQTARLTMMKDVRDKGIHCVQEQQEDHALQGTFTKKTGSPVSAKMSCHDDVLEEIHFKHTSRQKSHLLYLKYLEDEPNLTTYLKFICPHLISSYPPFPISAPAISGSKACKGERKLLLGF